MDRMARIAEMIAPSLAAMGYDLVRVQLSGGTRPILQIMAERADEAGMTVEDCADISRAVSALLDVEDPIDGAYALEVSSPGIDRPLTRLRDFERFAGFEARIETHDPLPEASGAPGRRRLQGRLQGIAGETVKIALAAEAKGQEPLPVEVPFAAIQRAKLILTDDLIAAAGG